MSGLIRVVKTTGFTTMSNYHLRDLRLSLKARGLLSTVLSLPDDWEYSINGLAAICKESRDGIRTALNELTEIGYVERGEQERVDGKFTAGDYTIFEVPPAEAAAVHRVAVTDTVTPTRQQPHGEAGHIKKDEIKKTNPPISPQGEPRKVQGRKAGPVWMPERFEAFWNYYPRGEGKDKARKAWDKLRPDDALLAEIARALQRQKASEMWMAGIGIPYASTYLNQRRWEDEARGTPAAGASPGGAAKVQKPEVAEW